MLKIDRKVGVFLWKSYFYKVLKILRLKTGDRKQGFKTKVGKSKWVKVKRLKS